jgi:hypothetical protein
METKPLKIDFDEGKIVEFDPADTIPAANLPVGASGSFTAQSGETVVVVNGLITQIDPP